ncbi:MAG: ABC transporter substrate-binding protein [Candidatus Cloacimonetes bacterium]|nr:ABC transporter substrate-binding protein [Candidatus Cloacimonadota bacterium]
MKNIILSLLFSCVLTSSFTLDIEYSKSFSIQEFKDYKLVKIFNADGTELYQSFVLAKNIESVHKDHKTLPFIKIPLKKFASMSTTHLFQLKQLGETRGLTGVGFFRYISDKQLVKQLKLKKAKELGMPGQMNLESTIASKADVVFSYYVSSDEGVVDQVKKLGTQTIYIQEYLESHPLAYAEWIKLFACFFDKEREGNQIFNHIKSKYLDLKEKISDVGVKPSVLINENYGGTWYVPNKDSFMATLINDAGGHYIFDYLPGKGSSKLSFETVVAKGINADYWINPGQATSLAELQQNDSRYKLFHAFKNQCIYNCNKRSLLGLPNTYFDEALSQPHLLLDELISIFHHQLLKTNKKWYHRLK